MLKNRPLFANSADERRFVPVSAFASFSRSIEGGRNTLLVGERGSGKTSALHMVEFRLRAARLPAVYVSLASSSHIGAALATLVRAAAESSLIAVPPASMIEAALDDRDPFAPNALLALIAEAPHDSVFLLDDVSASVGHGLFGRLRDAVWEVDRTWGVAVQTDEASGVLEPPADAFFDRIVELRPFTDQEIHDFLNRRIGLPARQQQEVARHLVLQPPDMRDPRALVALVTMLLDENFDPQAIVEEADRRRRIAESAAGRAGAMLVAEMEGRPPVSASDADLLRSLGWTRPRAVDVLNRLERVGVVWSFPEAKDGPGRPRKMYALRQIVEEPVS